MVNQKTKDTAELNRKLSDAVERQREAENNELEKTRKLEETQFLLEECRKGKQEVETDAAQLRFKLMDCDTQVEFKQKQLGEMKEVLMKLELANSVWNETRY